MNNFSLSRKKEQVFPTTIEVDGEHLVIKPDFRNVLKIMRMLDDDRIYTGYKDTLICKWFFEGEPPKNGVNLFIEFMTTIDKSNDIGCNRHDKKPPRFDFEFDAEEIYSSFLAEYGIDLFQIDFMHWYRFKILLHNLSAESSFKQKIDLRFMDLSGFKGKNLQTMTEAKEAVQLPIKYTKEELAEIEEFENMWGKIGVN